MGSVVYEGGDLGGELIVVSAIAEGGNGAERL